MGIVLPLLTATLTITGLLIIYTIIVRMIGRSFFPRFDLILRSLPDLNCGACGFKECLGFAQAVADGTANPAGCVPGGPKAGHAIADILGITAKIADPVMAAVHCKGGKKEVKTTATYQGIEDCHAAILINNGTRACVEGCLGLGTCVHACPFNALSINENKVAIVDRQKCMPAAHGSRAQRLNRPSRGRTKGRPLQGRLVSTCTATVGFTHGYSRSSPSGSMEQSNLFESHWSNQWLTA